jgi:hypothetical protein
MPDNPNFVFVYLDGSGDFWNYAGKLLEHCVIGQVEDPVDVVMANIHGVESLGEALLINWGGLTWATKKKTQEQVKNGVELVRTDERSGRDRAPLSMSSRHLSLKKRNWSTCTSSEKGVPPAVAVAPATAKLTPLA